MPQNLAPKPCPCGRLGVARQPVSFTSCCGQYVEHFATAPAPDSESLMRSRYTAFVQERADYLLATWHASHHPASVEFEPGVKWLGLEVRSHRQIDDTHAEVEFVARQKPMGGPAVRLHERSRFVRESGRWYYTEGEQFQ